jgi:hypothetical protein
MGSLAFWDQVRRRRNHFFFVWVGWLVAGPVLFLTYSSILPASLESAALFLALGTWMAFWYYIMRRLTTMKCFACGNTCIAHPFFFMRHAKCASCGVKPSDGESTAVLPPNKPLERTRDR